MASPSPASNRTVTRYLERRTRFATWPLQGDVPAPCSGVVVIPALGEFPGILDTLADLAACRGRRATLVIVVVNHRLPPDATSAQITANQQTLSALRSWDQHCLPVAWVDAASPGRELPPGEGVGLARKLGLDWGLQVLAAQAGLEAPLICLDADTRVDENYLDALYSFFEGRPRWAGVLPYAHAIDGDPPQQAAILCYEFFLRAHAGELFWAGSPYGFHAIGSAMACTARAYAAVSGMNRRRAGEDFYFLQQLAKTGEVENVPGTVVRPSGRASHRVPFGTGRRVQRFLEGDRRDEYRLYHPDSYDVIRRWLATAAAHPGDGGARQLERAAAIHPELRAYLAAQDFVRSWDRIVAQTPSPKTLAAQFHRWFDGFRTLKCLHHLRDTVWPEAPMFEALGVLLRRLGHTPVVDLEGRLADDLPRQRQLLEQLRNL